MRGEADEGGDLLAGQAAELRQVGDQRRGHDRTDAAHPAQSLGEAVELPIAGDVALDRLLDGLKALGQRRDDDRQALANKRVACEIGAAAFRLAGVDELPAPGGQRPQALVSAKGERQIRSLWRRRDTGRSAWRRLRSVLAREALGLSEKPGSCWGAA